MASPARVLFRGSGPIAVFTRPGMAAVGLAPSVCLRGLGCRSQPGTDPNRGYVQSFFILYDRVGMI